MNKSNNISVKDAAKRLGKCEQFVRIGLQRGLLPIGVAYPVSGKNYCYHISKKLMDEYLGESSEEDLKNE